MSEVNIPLLRKAVEWAEAEAAKPEELCEWYQGHFVLLASADPDELDYNIRARLGKAADCGTCFCIAGKVAFDETGREDSPYADRIAAKALGLTEDQADALFHASNTIADVRRIAEDLAGERL